MSEMLPSRIDGLPRPEEGPVAGDSYPTQAHMRERRRMPRFPLKPKMFITRVRGLPAAITLKDISCGGASGLMSEPLTEGARLVIEFDPRTHVEAEVRWVSRLTVGLEFLTPLKPSYVAALSNVTTRNGERLASGSAERRFRVASRRHLWISTSENRTSEMRRTEKRMLLPHVGPF